MYARVQLRREVVTNDTGGYNVAYCDMSSCRNDIVAAAMAPHIHTLIEALPQGDDAP